MGGEETEKRRWQWCNVKKKKPLMDITDNIVTSRWLVGLGGRSLVWNAQSLARCMLEHVTLMWGDLCDPPHIIICDLLINNTRWPGSAHPENKMASSPCQVLPLYLSHHHPRRNTVVEGREGPGIRNQLLMPDQTGDRDNLWPHTQGLDGTAGTHPKDVCSIRSAPLRAPLYANCMERRGDGVVG